MSTGPIENTARALSHWHVRHQAMSNNLANAATSGFKGERVFGEIMADRTLESGSRTDLQQGQLTYTGSPLDVALVGEGYLVVGTPQGDRLARGGSFELDANSRLVDDRGFAVMGERGELILPPGEVEVGHDGSIRVDQALIGRLRVVSIPAETGLVHEGGSRFAAPVDSWSTIRPEDRDIRQGNLEESNVGPLEGMVEMISIQRAYAAVEKAVEALDGQIATAVDLGRPV